MVSGRTPGEERSMRRVLPTFALLIAAMAVLAWPLSRLGVHVWTDGAGRRQAVWLAQGWLRWTKETGRATRVLEREQFGAEIVGASAPAGGPVPLRPAYIATGYVRLFNLPLVWVLAPASVLLALTL